MSLAEQLAARKAKLNVAPKVEPKVDLDPADAQAEVCPSVANLDGARRRGVTSQESSKAADEAPPCPATTVLEGAPRDEQCVGGTVLQAEHAGTLWYNGTVEIEEMKTNTVRVRTSQICV